jgi:hypothetical protein
MLQLPHDMAPREVLRALAAMPELSVESFELALPTMDDVFVRVVNASKSTPNEGAKKAAA